MDQVIGMNRLPGRVYAITGSTKGIGEGIARRLAAEGAKVVVSGRSSGKGEALAAEYPGQMHFVQCDVTKPADCEKLIAETVRVFGRIDGLINNAGIFPRDAIEATPEELYDRVMGTNVKGSFFCTKYAVEQMIRQGDGGNIVNIGSTHWKHGPGVYGMSKGGMHALTHNIAHAYANDGIRCNWVTVGWVLSEGEIEMDEAEGYTADTFRELMELYYPKKNGRYQTEDDIALAVVYLLSDESSQVTSGDIEVHGAFRFLEDVD